MGFSFDGSYSSVLTALYERVKNNEIEHFDLELIKFYPFLFGHFCFVFEVKCFAHVENSGQDHHRGDDNDLVHEVKAHKVPCFDLWHKVGKYEHKVVETQVEQF